MRIFGLKQYTTDQLEAAKVRLSADAKQARNYILDNDVLGDDLRNWNEVYNRKTAAVAGIDAELQDRAS